MDNNDKRAEADKMFYTLCAVSLMALVMLTGMAMALIFAWAVMA